MNEMSLERPEDFYGCEEMAPGECLALACEYKQAALHLKKIWRARKPSSRAPFRFTAIHAIELYLTGYLLHVGESWPDLRGFQHNLLKRHERAAELGLVLDQRTIASLGAISSQREYVRSRYGHKEARLSQLNRLEATLERVSTKVVAAVSR